MEGVRSADIDSRGLEERSVEPACEYRYVQIIIDAIEDPYDALRVRVDGIPCERFGPRPCMCLYVLVCECMPCPYAHVCECDTHTHREI